MSTISATEKAPLKESALKHKRIIQLFDMED